MKKKIITIILGILIVAISTICFSSGREENLSVNTEVTAKIRVFDREFFKEFDVYSAGVREYPTALLFDHKDDYHLPSRLWETPLREDEIIYAIERLDDQHEDRSWGFPLEPRALDIVNKNGRVLGYMYTSLLRVLMDRKKDGRVTVFLPTPQPYTDDDKDDKEKVTKE